MITKTKICPVCIGVSFIWLVLSAGVALGYLSPSTFLVPIALLMGGTVVGIAYLGEKRCHWAAQHPQKWKWLVVIIGMPTAYLLVSHISKLVVFVELIILLNLAYLLFIKTSKLDQAGKSEEQLDKIEKQMEQCC